MLPSCRTLQLYKANMSLAGSGFQPSVFESLMKIFDEKAKSKEDRDVILAWDATGYRKSLKFDKHNGRLLGFGCDPETFSMHQMWKNKVNCFMVVSPEQNLKEIRYPVAYYHCSKLDSTVIRHQLDEVLTGLDNIGLRVICLVCDGASEHAKYFNMVLNEGATHDDTIKVRVGNVWVVSDAPHLLKKFRNNWLSSGERDFHTRRMFKDGFHIGWEVMKAVYTVATTLSNGDQRPLSLIPKLSWDVIHPSCIQQLRVSLASIPFSKTVRDFVCQNFDQVVDMSKLREGDVRVTLEYMGIVDEVFQLMNSKYPITWDPTDDGHGRPIGLRDKCDTSKGYSLNFFAKIFGVSVQYLMEITGLPSPGSVPEPGTVILIDRPERLLRIASYFNEWKAYVSSIPDITKKQRSTMFITHWLFDDLRRTCHSMVELIKKFIPHTNRRWVPRRFNQDPIESLFGQIRNLAGSNTDLDRSAVDMGMNEIRTLGLKNV